MPSRIRDRIIAAAAQCFAAKGLAGTSTKEIAVSAGVNETSLFRLFGGKDQLFDAALMSQTVDARRLLRILAEEPDFRAAMHRVAVAFDRALSVVLVRLAYFASLERPGTGPMLVDAWSDDFLDPLASRIRAEQKAGRARRVNADAAALSFNHIIFHHFTWVHIFAFRRPSVAPRRKTLHDIVEVWVNGVLKSK